MSTRTRATRSAAAAVLLACVPAGAAGPADVILVGQWNGFSGSYADVWGEGDYAYIGHFGDSAVHIVNISDPAVPVGAEYDLPPVHDPASAQDVKVADGLLFISLEGSGAAGVHIVDVRDPESPTALVDISISGFNAIHNTFYDSGFLYMADSGTPRVGIIDLTGLDPDNPPPSPITTPKWILEDVGTSFVHDVTVLDGRLYAAAWDSGLYIYDVTNVATDPPAFLGQTPDGGDNTHSAWPTADGAFVITGEERPGGGIKVYRISDQADSLVLELTDSFALPSQDAFSVHNQVVVGNRLYNSWYEAGLLIFDIDPVTGELLPGPVFDTPESVWGVYPFLGSGRVLLSERVLGLFVVSVRDPLGDLDGDGVVGVVDFLGLLGEWGPCPGTCPPPCAADLNGDCNVGVEDFLQLLANWG